MSNNSIKSVVLIIEDDVQTANDLMVEYKKAGDEVVICTEPYEATNVATAIVPQLIIISVGLSTKDGFLLALEMKKVSSLEDTPIVFITPEIGCDEIARLAFTLGSVDVITKPIKPKEIRDIVQQTAVSKGICQLKQLTKRLSERSIRK
jgi:PleD family two-component response regulator